VELVLSDNAWSRRCSGHGRADCTTYNLTACLEALELIQITLSANGAFSAEIEDKLADVVDDVSFVQRNTQLRSRSSSLPPGRHL
jgi:hypothetical protein